MSRSTLPKAYLRLDPNIDRSKADTRWDFIRLLCEANRQTRRGRFKNRALFDGIFGRVAARKLIAAGDAVELPSGEVGVPGWDEWQEGDVTVAERQRRIRQRRDSPRDSSVTSPLLDRIPTPSISTSSRGSTEGHKTLGRGASANGADDLTPTEAGLSRLLRRSPTPRQLSTIEEMVNELPDGVALATIEKLIEDPPTSNVFGVLIDRLRSAKPSRSERVGPKRSRVNDYDALAKPRPVQPRGAA